MRKFRTAVYCLLCALVIISLLTINNYQRPQEKPVYGTPVQFHESLDINRINIDQIADDDGHLYLLDAYEGILRVFDLNGNYLQTRMFHDYMNGAFKLAVKDHCLYVSDPQNDVYVFKEGQFNQFIQRNDAKSILENIDFEKNSTNYVIRFASVWKVCDTGDICVIKRPLSSMLYQRNIRVLIVVAFVSIFAFVHFFFQRKRKIENGSSS